MLQIENAVKQADTYINNLTMWIKSPIDGNIVRKQIFPYIYSIIAYHEC